MALASGNALDRYLIEELIGSGAMGRVYRAHDRRLRRAVALKVVEGAASGAEAHAAVREARAAAAIVHPNVTAVYDVDHAAGTSYIVMELVPGTPLRKLIGDPAIPLGTRLRWLVEIAAALAAAHQAGVIHRDVKPENVIVREDGLAKVLDFGVARIAQAMTPALGIHGITTASAAQTGLAGTPAYMAPEQIEGTGVDGRADQFAWGVVAYELLAGRLPWRSVEGPFGVLAAILNEQPEPLPDAIPAQVSDAVLRALSKSRDARFPSMVEAGTPLIPYATGPLPPLGPPPDSHTRARAPVSKRVAPMEPPPMIEDAPRVAPLTLAVEPRAAEPRIDGPCGSASPQAPEEPVRETAPPPSLDALAVSARAASLNLTTRAAKAARPAAAGCYDGGLTRDAELRTASRSAPQTPGPSSPAHPLTHDAELRTASRSAPQTPGPSSPAHPLTRDAELRTASRSAPQTPGPSSPAHPLTRDAELRTASPSAPQSPSALRAPDFAAPIDLEGHIALLPCDAACKGMFPLDLLRVARGRASAELHALAGLPDRRYVAFRDYPMRDYLRLAVAVGRAAYPAVPTGQALRRIGLSAFDMVMTSQIGRTVLGVHGRDVERVLLALPRAYRLVVNFGEISVETTRARPTGRDAAGDIARARPAGRDATLESGGASTLVLRARGFATFLDTYQVGFLEGALRRCHAHGRLRVGLTTLADGVIEIALM